MCFPDLVLILLFCVCVQREISVLSGERGLLAERKSLLGSKPLSNQELARLCR